MSSTRHEQVYHAAHRRQAASLPLTASRLRGLKKACQVEGEKTAGLFAVQESFIPRSWRSGSARRVQLSGLLKQSGLIALVFHPDRKKDSRPDVGQSTNGDGMALAFCSFSLVILPSPRFKACALPGELVKRIAQRLDTAQASMGLVVRPALEKDWRSAAES